MANKKFPEKRNAKNRKNHLTMMEQMNTSLIWTPPLLEHC